MSGLPAPSPAPAARVLVAEPAPLLREGLASLLDGHDGVSVVGRVAGLEEALRLVGRLAPDVLLANLQLLRDGAPPPAVRLVALVEDCDAETLRACTRALTQAGPAGFIARQDDVEALFEALRRVAEGETWFSPRVAARLLPARRDPAREAGLTPRQRVLLCRVAAGQPLEQVADELCLAPGTVRNHLSAIYARLGVRTRAEAVAWAWRAGLVRPDGEATRGGSVPSDRDSRHATS